MRASCFSTAPSPLPARGTAPTRPSSPGLLGLSPDDDRVPGSFALAEERGLSFTFSTRDLRDVHPNSVLIRLEGDQGGQLEVGASLPRRRSHPGVPGGRAGPPPLPGPCLPWWSTTPTSPAASAKSPERWHSGASTWPPFSSTGVGGVVAQSWSSNATSPFLRRLPRAVRALPGILRVTRYTPESEERQ